MSEGDTWSELQAHKKKQDSLRERIQRRKKERQGILSAASEGGSGKTDDKKSTTLTLDDSSTPKEAPAEVKQEAAPAVRKTNPLLEKWILVHLSDKNLSMPVNSLQLNVVCSKAASELDDSVSHEDVTGLVEKLAIQNFIKTKPGLSSEGIPCVLVTEVDYSKLEAIVEELKATSVPSSVPGQGSKKRKRDRNRSRESSKSRDASPVSKDKKKIHNDDIQSMLSTMTTIQTETKKVGEDILDLLNIKSAKEQLIVEKFKSQGGANVQEFCEHGTREECKRNRSSGDNCKKVHFRKIIQKHTDESLGDCSFLNTCFHMDTCKYVHYEVDYTGVSKDRDKKIGEKDKNEKSMSTPGGNITLIPPQWIQCDLRYLDFSVIGKFSVVMADPPWDIHMELPYGTMQDDEMRKLAVPKLQDEGYIFLWVTGRAMELGRECLRLWGYDQCDELIWVKTNQLQRLIRTGRTGHWLNHGKEHCLIGVKGKAKNMNNGLDCDVLVAEVRSTSHKPDEIYGLIERLSPGTRKVELFGRPHNVQPNWLTLGNQLDGVRLMEADVVERFKEKYPNGIQQLAITK
ncbi:N6-adenosine-methyltransferase catalytic subunit-like [Dendronephthya gigantea]|uniref:N6-adenosine-methyltransferase catalytic subunit-like n=1 Tax=Dendronephthya gigantea TaxID=151771 RepID=UPI00106B8427|nr:N6-adenosine-methyltransferase catalytic subunit-like [Dendronephthya gigantea]